MAKIFTIHRLINGFAFIFALVAFILSILCLFAGSSEGFLDEGSVMSVNTSRIGQTPLFDSVNTTACNDNQNQRRSFDDFVDGVKNATGDVIDTLNDKKDCLVSEVKSKVNELASDLADSVADALNLPDFFDLHVMNFCIGKFEPADYLEQNITNPERNVTYCSPRVTDFNIELTQFVKEKLPDGVTLEDIHWPDEIQDTETAVRTASRAMVIFYAMGVGCAGFCTILSLINVLSNGGIFISLINVAFAALGLLVLLISSAISTAVARKISSIINDKGEDIGIEAQNGSTYLGMTWTSAILMLLVIVTVLLQMFLGRKMKGKGDISEKA